MQTRTRAVRLLALAAVLAMVVCCLPLQAFAAGEDTRPVTLNIYDIVNGKQVEERTITVAADAICVNTGSIALPEGYEFTETGDLPIRDGWVYVEVKPVEKKPVDPEQPDGGQSGSGSGTTTANQTSANQKTLPRTGSAGTMAGGALGLSGAIGAAVYAFVIRRRLG